MTPRRLAAAAAGFALVALALVGFVPRATGGPDRLAAAGSPVSVPVVVLLVVLFVAGIAFLVVGRRRRRG